MMTLSLRDRFHLMWRAMVGQFDQDSAAAAHGLLAGLYPGRTQSPPERSTANYLQAYSSMPWVRAIAGRIAGDISAVEWKLYAERRNGRVVQSKAQYMKEADRRAYLKRFSRPVSKQVVIEEIDSHLFLDAFNTMNPFMVGASARKITMVHLDLVGEAFWLKERNGLGVPTAFWPLPPHWVQSLPTPAYPFYKLGYRTWQKEIPETEILWMADPDPLNPYGRGTGIMKSLGDELETDEYVAKHTKGFFYNRAMPDFVVMPKGETQLSTTTRDDLEANWIKEHGGLYRVAKPKFLTQALDIHQFDQNFRSMQLVQIRELERNIIVQTFGIPPEKLGIIENSNRATAQASDFIHGKQVLTPRLEFLRGQFQEKLLPEYDERLILDYVSPVEEDHEFHLAVAEKAPWSLTVNEWREMAGQDRLEDDQGQVFAIPLGMRFQEGFENAPSPTDFGPFNSPEDMPEDMPMEEEGILGQAFLKTAKAGKFYEGELHQAIQEAAVCEQAGDWATAITLQKAFAEDPDDLPDLSKRVSRLEPRFRRQFMQALQANQGKVNMERLIALVQASNWAALERELHLNALDEDLEALSPLLHESYLEGAKFANGRLPEGGLGAKFDLVNPHAAMFARRHAGELITHLTRETQRALPKIRQLIEAAYTQGLPPVTLERRLRSVVRTIGLLPRQVDAVKAFMVKLIQQGVSESQLEKRVVRYGTAQLRVRGLMIARTEIIRASNEGQQALWFEARQQGFLTGEEKRVWLVSYDDALDTEICEPLADETTTLNEPFVNQSNGRQYMNPPAHPNCRCSVGLAPDN